ncbi:3 beta-hydroxysteroid dehydrogenase/Delta 5--_4-isomerase [Rubripirellula tenax]|uniref:3 beta-hydroxysteroid dehydrogenase/Delta 5-->4-isomerase n=1 Tax=Rubripirellula tenax TaxID=2528015 RepID=A0A5C6EI65_9BACT|nr:SDR family NAD(P)-dependent oxidoreductase [Rubripirellula tenax]TWU47341.1 3 beta-hydroxysteroid dehydrogenase/Delta 5-->4-isomerase [Rubripirellula tenax]
MTHALVTGSTGFIGRQLVKHLVDRGDRVTCLVRSTSNRRVVDSAKVDFVTGDVTDFDSVSKAVHDVDVVYHLAAVTKAFRRSTFLDVNQSGVDNVARACGDRGGNTTLVLVSSLAAAGPSRLGRPLTESDIPHPVSTYGITKLAGEIIARRYAGHVPTTIVRPPIVMGEGDADGFAMFQSIARTGLHFSPGLADTEVSMIDVMDLVRALTLVAEKGKRMGSHGNDASAGVYFAAADEVVTYGELGRMIGRAVGRDNAIVAHMPKAVVWGIAGISDLAGRIRRRPNILNWDKAREATAGSWTCSAANLMGDTGFAQAMPMATRIRQTAEWYFANNWLPMPRKARQRGPVGLEQIRNASTKTLRDT